MINGYLRLHTFTCNNLNCSTNEFIDNDKTNASFHNADVSKDMTSLVNFHIKCKFEKFLDENPNDFNFMLSYTDFLYNQLNNVALCTIYLKKNLNE